MNKANYKDDHQIKIHATRENCATRYETYDNTIIEVNDTWIKTGVILATRAESDGSVHVWLRGGGRIVIPTHSTDRAKAVAQALLAVSDKILNLDFPTVQPKPKGKTP